MENKYVQCENGHKDCYICLKKWHGQKECDEEVDKEFQIWKKDKIVKRCPRCKIYTEKNKGCNHMTCSECKFMWCWLCEGEYSDIHYIHGQCKGLQFANINYLNEVYDEKARSNAEHYGQQVDGKQQETRYKGTGVFVAIFKPDREFVNPHILHCIFL